jgi:hypothetical protein
MGNECEVCLKSDDDSNRRNQVGLSLKLHDQKRTAHPAEQQETIKESHP